MLTAIKSSEASKIDANLKANTKPPKAKAKQAKVKASAKAKAKQKPRPSAAPAK